MSTELLRVESRYWNSMKDRDPREAEDLTDDECIIVGAQGVMAVSPEMVAKMLEGGTWQIARYALGGAKGVVGVAAEVVGKMLEGGTWEIDRYALDESKAQIRMVRDDIAIVAYP